MSFAAAVRTLLAIGSMQVTSELWCPTLLLLLPLVAAFA